MNIEIWFNSGQADAYAITDLSKIDRIRIKNSNEAYYPDALIQLYNLDSSEEAYLKLNTTVDVFIDDSLEFYGYIARVQKQIMGTRLYKIQAIGKTYDLWRFRTENARYSNVYSGYIVSSLIATYCSGNGYYVEPPDIGSETGAYINSIDLSNRPVGDAISRLSKFDGYHFYIDRSGKFHYYLPESTVQFTISSQDILGMDPIEHSDETVINKCLVIGAKKFEKLQPATRPSTPDGYMYLKASGQKIAQKITAPDLKRQRLSAISAWLGRTEGVIGLESYIASNSASDLPGNPVSEGYEHLSWHAKDGKNQTWYPFQYFENPEEVLEAGNEYWVVFYDDDATSSRYWTFAYSLISSTTVDFGSDPGLSGSWDYGSVDYGYVDYDEVNDRINFYAKERGWAEEETFSDTVSKRIREFKVGPFYTDLIEFKVSANIWKYISGSQYSKWKRTDEQRFRPRLMLGLVDASSNVYPMFGFEFDLAP